MLAEQTMRTAFERTAAFCRRFGLEVPVLEAPMAGACPVARAAAVAEAGGMAGLGALLMSPDEMGAWVGAFRRSSDRPLQINLWVPDPAPERDPHAEDAVARFLGTWGPPVTRELADAPRPDFSAQCAALLEARPTAASSIMGLFSEPFVAELKARGIAWFATVTTVAEALAAEAHGADVIVAQGMEAGGHRGAFDPAAADRALVGLMALVPRIVDRVRLPVVASGGIADGRGLLAALTLGASAVQVGTVLLRCPESQLPSAWSDALARTEPEATRLTRAFSGRPGRAIENDYVRAAEADGAPRPRPHPVQRALTGPMRRAATLGNDVSAMQAWAGQAAALARVEPAGQVVRRLWREARSMAGLP